MYRHAGLFLLSMWLVKQMHIVHTVELVTGIDRNYGDYGDTIMQFKFPPGTTSALPQGFTLDRSTHFHCRNLSAAYHHSSFSQGHDPFPYPWSRIPGLYSHCAFWISAFTQPQASKETCLSGKAAFTQTKTNKKNIQNTNKWKRGVVCVRIKSTDVNPLGFCMCIISAIDYTTHLYPLIWF